MNLKMTSYIYHDGKGKYSYMVEDKDNDNCWVLEADEQIGNGGFYPVRESTLTEDQYNVLLPVFGVTDEQDTFFQAVFGNAKLMFTQLESSVGDNIDDED